MKIGKMDTRSHNPEIKNQDIYCPDFFYGQKGKNGKNSENRCFFIKNSLKYGQITVDVPNFNEYTGQSFEWQTVCPERERREKYGNTIH